MGFTTQEPMNERIIKTAATETYYNFPSANLDYRRNIRFILPEDYQNTNTKYPVIFLLRNIEGTMSLPKTGVIFVIAEIKEADHANEKAFAKFIEEELVIYTDVNYRTDSRPQAKRLQAEGKKASLALYVFNHTNSFLNVVLLNAADTVLPMPINKKEGANAYFESNRESAYFLDRYFTDMGMEYGKSLLYAYNPSKETGFECGAAPCFPAKLKYKLSVNKAKVSLENDYASITAKLSDKYDYIIKKEDLRISPPVLAFDEVKQVLTPIDGAEKGTITLSVKEAKTKLKLVPVKAK